jgi:hypothetical protein
LPARLHPPEPARDTREPAVELGQPILGVYAVPSGRHTIFVCPHKQRMITWRPVPTPTGVPIGPGRRLSYRTCHNKDAVAVKIDAMIAAELVGLWSTCQNAARAMSVGRFTWNCPEAGTLEIRYTTAISGSWEPGRAGLATIGEQRPDDTVVLTRYTLDQDATPMVTGPFTAWHLDQPIEFSRAYALVRRDIHGEDDPNPGIDDA